MRVRGDAKAAVYVPRVTVKQVTPQAIDLLHDLFGGHCYAGKPTAAKGRSLISWTKGRWGPVDTGKNDQGNDRKRQVNVTSPVIHVRIPEPLLAALDEVRGDESRSVWVLGAIGLRLSPLAEAVAEVAVATQPDTRGPAIPVTVLTSPTPDTPCPHPRQRVLKGLCHSCGTGGL